MTGRARFLKKNWQPELGPNGPKSDPKQGFLPFSQVAYNDSLQQCLTSSEGKILEKNFGAQICAKGAKIGPETRFVVIFSSLVH